MIQAIKKKYNATLGKFEKATKWMEAPERAEEEVEKYFMNYIKITKQLSAYLNQLRDAGVTYSNDEVVNGFNM